MGRHSITEFSVEQIILEILEELGYQIIWGLDIALASDGKIRDALLPKLTMSEF